LEDSVYSNVRLICILLLWNLFILRSCSVVAVVLLELISYTFLHFTFLLC